jgi:hypothetical protein
MQSAAGIGRQPNDIAGVGGNFRLIQHNFKHGFRSGFACALHIQVEELHLSR